MKQQQTPQMKNRVIVLTGHYGSGKTEAAVNLAVMKHRQGRRVALLDLDIANPYFRSREMQDALAGPGIDVISNAYGYDITADLPALSPMIARALSDGRCDCIVDAGGNADGAKILNQFKSHLVRSAASFFMVVNIFRPETANADKIIAMKESIERETGMKITGMINNTNLLRETRPEHIAEGIRVLNAVSAMTGVPIAAHCCEERLIEESGVQGGALLLPLHLYMRPGWLDR
jgi:G3E family GTPase